MAGQQYYSLLSVDYGQSHHSLFSVTMASLITACLV